MIFDLGRSCVIFLSTHIVKDVEFSCHGMTLLYGGIQRYTGAPAGFMAGVQGRVFEVELPFPEFDAFSAAHHVVAIHEHGDFVNVRFITPGTSTDVPGAQSVRPNLEDAYVDFIRARQREEEALVQAG
jgi:ABC-type multidrug transport system ATPase subunit